MRWERELTELKDRFGPVFGRPVTRHAVWYERDNHPLCILDTKGLETAAYEETWATLRAEVENGRSDRNSTKHIHTGWVCVQEPALRFEEAEQRLVELLKSTGIPIIVVLTKHGMFSEFTEEVARRGSRAVCSRRGCANSAAWP